MNFPVYIQIGGGRILLHSVAELLAFFLGFRYFQIAKRRLGDPLSGTNRSWVFVGAIFGALIGSRLLGGLEKPHDLMKSKNILLYFYENKTIVGGLLGGLFGVEMIKKIIGEKKSSGDLFVRPILFALIIGRTGCFSMGVYEETYGLPTGLPWGMNLGDGILRHPVAIYEIVFLAILWISLSRIQRNYDLRTGALFKLFMMAYLLFRFLIDFIKPHENIFLNLSAIQWACIAGFVYYRRDLIQPDRIISNTNKADA